MIILNKKRLVILSSLILVSLFAFTFQIANQNKVVSTMALPVSNKVIVIDAGHGKPDEGDIMLKLRKETLQLAICRGD